TAAAARNARGRRDVAEDAVVAERHANEAGALDAERLLEQCGRAHGAPSVGDGVVTSPVPRSPCASYRGAAPPPRSRSDRVLARGSRRAHAARASIKPLGVPENSKSASVPPLMMFAPYSHAERSPGARVISHQFTCGKEVQVIGS